VDGRTVTVRITGDDPRGRARPVYLRVERRDGERWTTIADDGSWSTTLRWQADPWVVTVTWRPDDPGVYRLVWLDRDGRELPSQEVEVPAEWLPVEACTLPTAEQPLRAQEFAQLLRGATVVRHDAQRATVRVATVLEPQVRELVARESACCSFFTFTVRATPAAVEPGIEVTAEQVAVLDSLVALGG